MSNFPNEQQAPLLSCIYPSARAAPSSSTLRSLMCLSALSHSHATSSEPLCSLAEGLLLLLLQHCGVWGFPRSSLCLRALTCPIGWRGSVPHTSSARGGRGPTGSAQPTPPLPWPAAHPTPGHGRGKGQAGVLASQRREEEKPAPLCYVGFLSIPECPKPTDSCIRLESAQGKETQQCVQEERTSPATATALDMQHS